MAKDAMSVIRAYVEGQAQLGYCNWSPGANPTDVLLATFPKSGSTWTSYLLHQLSSGGDDEFDDIKNVVVDITPGHWDPQINPFLASQKFNPRTYKTHGSYALAPKGARFIYIARDPKDIFWSLYQFIHDLFGLESRAPIDEFYRDYFVERFGTEHDIGNPWTHILSWFPRREAGDILWLHYEDFLTDLEPTLRAIAHWTGIEADKELISLVLRRSKMEHMRTIADKINPSAENYVGKLVTAFTGATENYARKLQFGKLRKGIAGDGVSSLPIEIAQEIDCQWQSQITPVLGFNDYAQMRKSCGFTG